MKPMPDADSLFSFARYLSWADLLSETFKEEMSKEINESDTDALRDHEWRWFGMMSYWYASLFVVIEAWDEMPFSDPFIDKLLGHPKLLRDLLRRYRNAVFHFQSSPISPKLLDLLTLGVEHVFWIEALHREIVRYFHDFLHNQMATEDQREHLRDSFESVVHWYPYKTSREADSLERTLKRVRYLLATTPDSSSRSRQELEGCTLQMDTLLRQGQTDWHYLRDLLLKQIDLGENSEHPDG